MVPKTATSQVVKMGMVLNGSTAGIHYLTLDTLTGAMGGQGGTINELWGLSDQGNFWLMWQTLANIGTANSAQLRFIPVNNGIGIADYGWAQLEPGCGPTARIRTTGTADVRREKDTLTIPATMLAGAGTIEVTASPAGGPIAHVLAQLDDGTAANRITIQRTAGGNIQAVFVSAGVVTATLDTGAHVAPGGDARGGRLGREAR